MTEEVELKIKRQHLIIFLVVMVTITIVYFTYPLIYKILQPMNSVNYNGYRLSFRGDLREANKIAVYPSDNDVYNLMTNPNLRNITIVFQNTTAGLDSVAVESFEITYKLRTAYLISGMDVGFSSQKTNNLRNVTSSQENIAIVLIPPSIANETAVRVDNNTVTISGKTQREFDLATIKFLMVSLGIKI